MAHDADSADLISLQNSRSYPVENILGAITESLPLVLWRLDVDGRFTQAQGSGLVDMQLNPARFIGQTLDDIELVYPDFASYARQALKGVHCRADLLVNEAHWFQVTYIPERDSNGEVIGVCGVSVNITERKFAEQSYQQTLERFAMAQEAANLGAFEYNTQTGRSTWTPQMETLVGLAQGEFDGSDEMWRRMVHPDDQKQMSERFRRTLLGYGDYENEFRIIRPDGSTRWFLARAKLTYDSFGRPASVFGVNIDITNQKQIEEEIKRAKQAAELASEAKTRFLANMSHEIRTPLGAILGFAELMKDARPSEAERSEYLQTILRNGALLSRVINEILDLSKIESERLEIERLQFPLRSAIEDVISLLTLQAQEKGLSLQLELSPFLPEMIVSDPIRLRQILINVIGNAIKFTEKGSVTVRVHPAWANQQTQRTIEFLVTDSGTGISPEQQSKLFKPFAQADSSTTRKYGGTGLGLVLAQRLSQALGGDLKLQDSTLNQGSTFKITIDSGNAQPTLHVAHAPEPKPPPQANGELAGHHILVVEDSPDNRTLISRFLAREGARVSLAVDGFEGVEKALSGEYDLILMDIQMPRMDGLAAVNSLRAQNYAAPVIAFTAHAMKGDRERCLQAGFDGYLIKPIDRVALIKTIRHHLSPKFLV